MSNKTGKILGGMVLAPFVLIALGIAYCEANKAYWDHRVKKMCEKDGGVTVFEKVEISKSNYPDIKIASNGEVILPSEKKSHPDDDFFYVASSENLYEDFPNISVYKYEQSTIRRKDNKTLSKVVTYTRGGGDFPIGISHPSSFGCGDLKNFRLDAEKQTFIVKGEQL